MLRDFRLVDFFEKWNKATIPHTEKRWQVLQKQKKSCTFSGTAFFYGENPEDY